MATTTTPTTHPTADQSILELSACCDCGRFARCSSASTIIASWSARSCVWRCRRRLHLPLLSTRRARTARCPERGERFPLLLPPPSPSPAPPTPSTATHLPPSSPRLKFAAQFGLGTRASVLGVVTERDSNTITSFQYHGAAAIRNKTSSCFVNSTIGRSPTQFLKVV